MNTIYKYNKLDKVQLLETELQYKSINQIKKYKYKKKQDFPLNINKIKS